MNIPTDLLVIVEFDTDQKGLRSFTEDGDMYDENNNLDDSGLTVVGWHPLPDDMWIE
ncbi:hypothetical protein [uncultured Paraglaciecola sp.]|uniref:hypothetical protein n=1 Tax=uncultured Paraglaciecola sp. TaxID=1765024 RepID=UPI0026316DFF|nr:hypothetical protein [uncultured Paraglaciecola sp.]